jgi:hypothetical protein
MISRFPALLQYKSSFFLFGSCLRYTWMMKHYDNGITKT